MIFNDSDDDSDKSNKSIIYNNSYDSSKDSIYLNFLNYKEKESVSSTSTRTLSYNTSQNNSYKSQCYFDSKIFINKDIESESKSKEGSYKSQNYLENIRYEKFKRIQKKNTKLKYKLVLKELLLNETKNLLYKSNYNIVMKELENKKYYNFGILYKTFVKSLEEGVKPINTNKINKIEMAKNQINLFKKKGHLDSSSKIEKYYYDKYGYDFKNDTKK